MNWKKIIVWFVAIVITLVVGIPISMLILVNHSPAFRQGVLADVEGSIYESTGARVAIRDFSLGLFPLNLDLYGVVVHGNEPEFGQPLLHADHVSTAINIDSHSRGKWNLRDVVIDHPVVHLFVNEAGESNLPQPKKNRRSATETFDLAIQEVLLHDTEVYCNDKKILLDAKLHKVQLTGDFDNSIRRYRGLLSYAEGEIKYGDYVPAVHNLELTFEASAGKFTVEHLALVAGDSRAVITGSVEDYNNPVVRATYDAQLATSDIAPFLKTASRASGVVHLTGTLSYHRDPSYPVAKTISLSGTVGSRELAVTTPGFRTEVRDLDAKYKLAGGNAEVENIHAQVLGGRLVGSLSIHDLAGASTAKLQARVKNASLEQLQAARRQDALPDAHLSGIINADTEATWSKTLQDLVAHGNATLEGALGQAPSTPLHGAIHADYAAAGQQVALRQSYIRTPQTSITLDGKVSEDSQLQVALRSGNLHELELLAENFRTASPGQPLQKLDLYGTASFSGYVTGSARVPQLKGELEARNLRVKGTSWKLLRTNIDASPFSLSFSNGDLEAATQGWTNSKDSSSLINLEVSVSRLTSVRKLATLKLRVVVQFDGCSSPLKGRNSDAFNLGNTLFTRS